MSRLLRADQVSFSQNFTTTWSVHQRAEAQTGDLIFAVFSYGFSATAVTPPDGTWTALTLASQGSAAYLAGFYKTATSGGAADYTFTGMANRPYIGYCAVIAGSAPTAATAGANSATAAATAITPASGSLVLTMISAARTGSVIPAVTGGTWSKRNAGLSGSDSNNVASYLSVYAIDDTPATATPSLTFALPVSGNWVSQSLAFPPNAQPSAGLLSDCWAPRSGLWAPILESIPVSGAWL